MECDECLLTCRLISFAKDNPEVCPFCGETDNLRFTELEPEELEEEDDTDEEE